MRVAESMNSWRKIDLSPFGFALLALPIDAAASAVIHR